jgi:hypothetical protein
MYMYNLRKCRKLKVNKTKQKKKNISEKSLFSLNQKLICIVFEITKFHFNKFHILLSYLQIHVELCDWLHKVPVIDFIL